MRLRHSIPLLAMTLSLVLPTGCQAHRPWESFERCAATIPAATRQAVVVDRDGCAASGITVRLYERKAGGWEPVGAPIRAVAGRNGLAPVGEKREGDGRTPSGVFPLERGFGYGPLATRIPYLVLTPDMIWIDDPRSPLYNRLADLPQGAGFSFETMRRKDDLYKYGIVVEYNTRETVPGAGSAIFFHVWGGPATTTAGCIATEEADMVRILRWLDPERRPVAVIGDACR